MTPQWEVTVRNANGILGCIHGLLVSGICESNSMGSQSQETHSGLSVGKAQGCSLRLEEGSLLGVEWCPLPKKRS